MSKSKTRTEKLKTAKRITGLLSMLLTTGPALGFAIYALAAGTLVVHKVTICFTLLCVLVLTVVAAVNKFAFKSKIWLILISLYLGLGNILTPIIIIGCCQIADEIIVSPLHRHYKSHYEMCKEIDIAKE